VREKVVFEGRGGGGQGSRWVCWGMDWCGGRLGEGFEVEGIILRELESVEKRKGDLFSYDCYARYPWLMRH